MLPRYKNKEFILDKLHRGFVNCCIAASVVTGSMWLYGVYQYFRYIRPLHKKMRLENEESLLAEGRALEDIAMEIKNV
ncbi:hypothetical protein WN55_04404 [Dufourea novaeangliae]|uniref:Uncharacterized protein n=1 Tax=Dufourea novaeangliae TaxID=178035 RepID=A0A154PMC6_DUFNO|nr:hypothetical protein WN55_04404 [Dufourea novaeangliae]